MVYMYHSFLIHSSADGHLGCFHVLAMINSAEMNIGVHVSLSDLVSLVSMSSSNCCFLTCIQVFQEAGEMVWYSHLFKNFPQNSIEFPLICVGVKTNAC